MQYRGLTWDEIITHYGLVAAGSGGEFRGACPLRNHEGYPFAFAVNPARGFFCHACGVGGGIGTFIWLMGSGAETGRGATRPETRPNVGGDARGQIDLDRLARDRMRLLATLPEVEPICPRDPAHPYFRTRGISPSAIGALGGGVSLGAGPFHRRAVFPVWTPDGRLVGHVGRAIDAETVPRYHCQQGFRKALLLYNERAPVIGDPVTGESRNPYADPIIVVEGIFDVAAVLAAGFPNVVALIGCMPSPFQLGGLSRYRRVFALLDADGPGREGAGLLRRVLGPAVTVVDLERGDPAETARPKLAELLGAAGAGRAALVVTSETTTALRARSLATVFTEQ